MSDPQHPYEPPVPPAPDQFRVEDSSFRVPESEFRVPDADRFSAPEPGIAGVPEPMIAAEPVPGMAGLAPVTLTSDGTPLDGPTVAGRIAEEVVAWLKTLASAAVYATLIVTFGFQVARVEGQSMAPTLADQDRLIVNKAAYRIGSPIVGDVVMLYYPNNPDKSFVKRIIAEEGDQIRIVDGRVYRNDVLIPDDYVPTE